MKKLWKAVKPYCTWKMLPIALTLWIFTNAIWYALAVIPHVPLWLRSIAIGYLAFIYLPFSAEKIVIIVFAPIIYRWIYKEDFKGGFGEDERQSKRVEKP